MITACMLALSALSHGIVLLFVFGGVALIAILWRVLNSGRRILNSASLIIGTAVLLSAFWVVPFLTSHAFMTDMKYEPRPSGTADSFWKMFFPLPLYWNISSHCLQSSDSSLAYCDAIELVSGWVFIVWCS